MDFVMQLGLHDRSFNLRENIFELAVWVMSIASSNCYTVRVHSLGLHGSMGVFLLYCSLER